MIRYIILIAVVGIIGAILARPKGRSPVLWFLLCAMFPLLIVAIAMLPSVIAKGINKKCPYCTEIIKEGAVVCKYCGMNL